MSTETRGSTRFVIIVVLLGLAMVGLVIRLVVLHLGNPEQDRATAAKTRTFKQTLSVPRGRILDGSSSSGILALNIGVKDIWADPSLLMASNLVSRTVARLSTLLEFNAAEVTERLCRTNSRFAYISRLVPDEKADSVASLKLPGIHMDDASTRSYPQNFLLCHVLGFVNSDGVGSWGLEQLMEKYLKGSPGLIESRLDGRRREMMDRRIREVPAKDGADVMLTIDQNLQYIVEKALDSAMDRNRARAAFVIMQRIRTGEILAMASRPAFDPNRYREARDPQKINRAISHTYEPGSTFKVSVIAGALDAGVVKPETMFDTENGRWLYQAKILRDYHAYSRLNVADILKKSSNIGAAKIAILLGNERMDRYLRAFHVGSKLGIDLPGEEGGIYPSVTKWAPISSSRIAIGQGVSVTGLQMLSILCTIANDGVVMKPYIIKQVVAADGTVLLRRQPEALRRAIRSDTAALMGSLLARVCEEGGTGTKAGVEGFRVAGKTGTAQKVIGGHYSETDYMASFVGYLPAENPEIGMIVVFDEPQPLHTGGAVSAPVFGEIAEQAVRYLGILPAEGSAPAHRAASSASNETF
jgi:cell division protein FtsI (penicillin-binding protein 3)